MATESAAAAARESSRLGPVLRAPSSAQPARPARPATTVTAEASPPVPSHEAASPGKPTVLAGGVCP